MRISNNTIANRVTRTMGRATTNMNKLNEQVTTGMKATRSSEDPGAAMKAFKVRRDLIRNSQTHESTTNVMGILDQTETALNGVKDVLSQAKESLVQGVNGTLSDSNKEIVANMFKNLQSEILQLANTNYAGKYVFGGPNTTTKPFTVDEDGKIFYNGEDMSADTVSTEKIYTNLNQGVKFKADGTLDVSTAFSLSTPGSTVFGYGVDENGNSNNIYTLLGEISQSLSSNNTTKMAEQMQKLNTMFDNTLVHITDVGERTKFVEFIEDRADTDELNLKKKQNDVEAIDTSSAIINYKLLEMAYNAALQMGAKVIQSSLLDYLR